MEHISETLWFCAVEWDDGQSGDRVGTVTQMLFLLSYKHNYIGIVYLVFIGCLKAFRLSTSAFFRWGALINGKSESSSPVLANSGVKLLQSNYNIVRKTV